MKKSTICTDSGARLIATAAANGDKLTIGISTSLDGMSVYLTPDQVGAHIFALEAIMETMEAARENAKREAFNAEKVAA